MKMFMNAITFIAMVAFLHGCTYSVNLIHSEGSASDIVDENQTPSTTISPTFDAK